MIPLSRPVRRASAAPSTAEAGLVDAFRKIRPVVYSARENAPPGARRDELRPRSRSMKTIFTVGVASGFEMRHFIYPEGRLGGNINAQPSVGHPSCLSSSTRKWRS